MGSIVRLCLLAAVFGLVGALELLTQTVPQAVQDAGGLHNLLAHRPELLWDSMMQAFSFAWWRFLFPIGLVCAGTCLAVRRVWRNKAGARKKRPLLKSDNR